MDLEGAVACSCPLCGGRADDRPSWLGSSVYLGQRFAYRRCARCRSLFVDPTPDRVMLDEMYGPSYSGETAGSSGGAEDDRRLRDLLASRTPGRLLDVGCGDGWTLRLATDAGWEVAGLEHHPDVARAVADRCGVPVETPDRLDALGDFDVVHLGDVLEHLLDPFATLARVRRSLAPGGVIVARGPLEAGRSLFTAALRLARTVRRPGDATHPPYHLVLATAAGQRALFERAGLVEQRFEVTETAWPAPPTLAAARAAGARGLALYAVRRCSQLASAALSDAGNRFFYVGRPA